MLGKSFRPRVDPLDPEALVVLVDFNYSRLADGLDKAVQRDPARRVHVHMVLVLNVLIIDGVRAHALRVVPALQQGNEVVLKLARELGNRRSSVRSDADHFAQVRLALAVRLETVLVAALLLTDLPSAAAQQKVAHLTVPLQTAEACCQLRAGSSKAHPWP